MPTVWIENTTSKCDHGGVGWGFGTCVWCPSTERRGSLGKYRIITEVKQGDLFINCYDSRVRGTSIAKDAAVNTTERPPNPGDWGYANAFLRIELDGYRELNHSVSLRDMISKHKAEISAEIESEHPSYNLFSWWPRSEWYPEGRVVISQGRFLARATPLQCRLFHKMVGLDEERFRAVLG